MMATSTAAMMADVTLDAVVRLRLTKAERNAWKAAAKAAKLSLSEWIHRRVTGTVTLEAPPPPAAAPTPKRKRSQ